MNQFDTLHQIIRHRRSTKPDLMNGKKIPDAVIHQLLELANWAPTHANTEPWRFVVLADSAVSKFCSDHADMYREYGDPEKFTEAKYQKLLHNGDRISHLIILIMKRSNPAKIPAIEEAAAVACAGQNILLGAAALGVAVLWSTGGMTGHAAMKKYLQLQEEDLVMGLFYMGYSDVTPGAGRRLIPLAEKVAWKR